MLFNHRDKLTILEKPDQSERINLEEAVSLLWNKPSIVIYVECKKTIYGIISIGDIERAWIQQQESVKVNQNFIHISENGYLQARQLFKDKMSINAIPIISKEGKLLGDYTRWSDNIVLGRFFSFSNGDLVESWWARYRKIVLVEPSQESAKWIDIKNEIKLIGGGQNRYKNNQALSDS